MTEDANSAEGRSDERIIEEYVLGVRITERSKGEASAGCYHFEAPGHSNISFDDLEIAQLYADIYFDVNGFVEENTGTRGVPPEVVQAGKDTLAAYLVTLPWSDVRWVASFYGVRPNKIERYLSWVRDRADEIRSEAVEHGVK